MPSGTHASFRNTSWMRAPVALSPGYGISNCTTYHRRGIVRTIPHGEQGHVGNCGSHLGILSTPMTVMVMFLPIHTVSLCK
jgi:hypothetical protein